MVDTQLIRYMTVLNIKIDFYSHQVKNTLDNFFQLLIYSSFIT